MQNRSRGGTIYTTQVFSDFVARLEFKLPPGGNNGLAIRYPGKGNTAYEGMCENQALDDNYEREGARQDRPAPGPRIRLRDGAGRPSRVPAADRRMELPGGHGPRKSTIKVELNGTVILDCDLGKVTQFLDDKAHPGKDRKRGYFGFAGHNDPVEFRAVEIRADDKN